MNLRVALLALVAVGCSPREPEPLRIALNPWPGYECLYLAQERGYFKDAGLAVQLVEYSSLADARRAFERGHVDGVCATLIELLEINGLGMRRARAALVTDYSNGTDVIVARAPARAPQDLRGLRVGVEVGSLGVFMLARALERAGLAFGDVIAVPSDQVGMLEEFRAGRLDAIVAYPPTSVLALAEPRAAAIFSSAEIPGEVIDIVAFDERVVRERGADLLKLREVWDRALGDVERDPRSACAVMAPREQLDPDAFCATLSGIRLLRSAQAAELMQPGGVIAKALRGVAGVLLAVDSASSARCDDPESFVARLDGGGADA